MRAFIVKAVNDLARNPEKMKLSLTEKRISEFFVVDKHIKAIGVASEKLNFAVSFRESGEATIRRQKQGAATKGHDNLEKTIKLSSLEGVYGTDLAEKMHLMLKAADIDGYAGHWKVDQLIGIHLGPEAEEDDRLKEILKFVETDKEGRPTKPYYPVNMDDLETSLSALKAIPNWQAIPVTGDNDLHDLISFVGQRGIVPQGSADETKFIRAINDAVAAIDRLRPADKAHKRVVQHGPQQSYPAFRMNEEGQRSLVKAVALPSYPLAMCCKGEWSLIRDRGAHVAFFVKLRLNMKSTWNQPDKYFAPIGGGRVVLQRSSSLGSVALANSLRGDAKDVPTSEQRRFKSPAPESANTAGLKRAASSPQLKSLVSQDITNRTLVSQPIAPDLSEIPEASEGTEGTSHFADPLPHDLKESRPT
jgi:hypothetical protein